MHIDEQTVTPLCKLAMKYGSDKCPQFRHTYTPFYYQILKDKRRQIKKVLEMGIGYQPGMPQKKVYFDPNLQRHYHLGASLYMWRDFFANAKIYGADIHPEVMFKDERIKTFLCDETNKNDLEDLIKKTGSDIDLFIDDGNHHQEYQIFMCKTLMPLLNKKVIYVIEDVISPQEIVNALYEYDCSIPELPPPSRKSRDNMLIIVKNKRNE